MANFLNFFPRFHILTKGDKWSDLDDLLLMGRRGRSEGSIALATVVFLLYGGELAIKVYDAQSVPGRDSTDESFLLRADYSSGMESQTVHLILNGEGTHYWTASLKAAWRFAPDGSIRYPADARPTDGAPSAPPQMLERAQIKALIAMAMRGRRSDTNAVKLPLAAPPSPAAVVDLTGGANDTDASQTPSEEPEMAGSGGPNEVGANKAAEHSAAPSPICATKRDGTAESQSAPQPNTSVSTNTNANECGDVIFPASADTPKQRRSTRISEAASVRRRDTQPLAPQTTHRSTSAEPNGTSENGGKDGSDDNTAAKPPARSASSRPIRRKAGLCNDDPDSPPTKRMCTDKPARASESS